MRQILRLTILLAGLLMTGCQSATEQKPPSNEAPMVQINSPASNARVPIGREVEIHSTTSDQSFIKRVELYVNGDLIREDAPPIKEGQIIFTVLQRWVPIEPGEVEVRVIAYDTEEKASYPVAIVLQVEGNQLAENAPTQGILIATEGAQVPNATLMPIPTQTAIPIPTQTAIPIPTQTPIPIPSDTPIPIPSDTPIPIPSDTPIPIPSETALPPPTPAPRIEGRVVAVEPINIRSAPGTNNIPLGILRPNDVVTGIARNGTGDWVKIVYGQANTEGWVFTSLVAWQTNVQTLPIH
ncbi:MAG: Ig-like domain-containing protein [Ardenticatenaceae bacterium]